MHAPWLLVLALTLALSAVAAHSHAEEGDGAKEKIAAVIDDFHDAASKADAERYFAHLTDDAVFLGTDATERWTKPEFEAFTRPYFDKGTGWRYESTERHIIIGPDGRNAAFDELLENASFGLCRGSGAVRLVDGTWRISQYNLSIPMPNPLVEEFVERIRGHAEKGEGQESEAAIVERHIGIIKSGVPILVAAKRSDLAEQLELAAHARELMLAGRKDKEALEIRENAPGVGQLAELLMFASNQANKQDKDQEAGLLGELGQHFLERWRKDQPKEKPAIPTDDVGLLRKALIALSEGHKPDAADLVERAADWRRLWLEGRRDEEVRELRKSAPGPKTLARLLRLAADLWTTFKNKELAGAIDAYAARLEGLAR